MLGGITEEILLKCISIPVSFNYGDITLLDHIHSGNHQHFQGYLLNLDKKQITLDNISAILRNRDCESDIEKWEEIFSGFPDRSDFDLGLSYTNLFYQLASGCGGPVQVTNDLDYYRS